MHKGIIIILKAIMALLFIITFAYVVIYMLGMGKIVSDWSYTTPWEDKEPPKIADASVYPSSVEVGDNIIIKVRVIDDSKIDYVKAEIQKPDENTITTIDLYDDGMHNDEFESDYIYGNTWEATEEGAYYVDIKVCDIKGNCAEYENIQ